jgi:hypothetical protein
VFGALLLVAMPAHTVSARIGDHHSLVTLFLLPAVSYLGIAIAERSPAALVISGIAFGFLVATSEFGVVIAGACLLLLVLLPNSFVNLIHRPRRATRSFFAALAFAVTVPIVVWPAGLFRLDLLRSLDRYVNAAVGSFTGSNNFPRPSLMIYLREYVEIAPAYLILFLAVLVITAILLVRRRIPRALVPVAILTLFLTVVMHLHWPARFRYSLYAATLVVLLAGWLLAKYVKDGKRATIAVTLCLMILAVSAPSAFQFAPPRFGYSEAAAFIERVDEKGGRILSSAPQILSFYLGH